MNQTATDRPVGGGSALAALGVPPSATAPDHSPADGPACRPQTTRVSWTETTRVSWTETTRVSWTETTHVSWNHTSSERGGSDA